MVNEKIYSAKVIGAKEKSTKMDELRDGGFSIVGENDNGDGTFTIFFRDTLDIQGEGR